MAKPKSHHYYTAGMEHPESLSKLFIVERHDEAMYITDVWAFTSLTLAADFCKQYRIDHPETCQYDEYDLDIYAVCVGHMQLVFSR